MEFPASHLGTAKEVKLRARKMVKAVADGATWAEAVGPARVNSKDFPSSIVIEGDGLWLKDQPQMMIALPFSIVTEKLRALVTAPDAPIVRELLETPWGTMSIMNSLSVAHLARRQRGLMEPLLQAALRWWPTWDAVGPRYTTGAVEPPNAALWDEPGFGIKMLLGLFGVSEVAVKSPLPPGGPAELLAAVQRSRS